MKRFIIIHYGEIGLKKGNFPYFLAKLLKRIRHAIGGDLKIVESLQRLMVELPGGFSDFEGCVAALDKVFGIKTFKFAFEGSTDLEQLAEEIWRERPASKPETFRVKVKRSMKLPFNSMEAERKLGGLLLAKGLAMKVKLADPEMVFDVEFLNEHGYFSFYTYQGLAGLPCNSGSKLVALLSSGIDSPVAAYRMMRRGARIIFVHFSSYPYSDGVEREHVEELVKILAQYQFDTKLYVINLGEFQKFVSLKDEINSRFNTLLYRRMMYRLAEEITKKEQAKGLVTGDSFAQVASQTAENLFALHQATTIPLFQPLIAYDKEEVIALAEKIGTFAISKLPCKDSCTMFSGTVAEIRATAAELVEMEKCLELERWTAELLAAAEIIEFARAYSCKNS